MLSDYKTIKLDKKVVSAVKAKYPGFSFNKALKMLLLSADAIDIGKLQDPVLAENKAYIDARLRAMERLIQERFEKVEDALQYR